jgi:hypothetical protein
MGNKLTRKNLMAIAASHLTETNNPLVLPGMIVKTTPGDHFPIQQMQLERWQGDHFALFGNLINVRGS